MLAAIAFRWIQESNTFQLVDAHGRPVGSQGRPGQAGYLVGPLADLNLAKARALGKGQTVQLSVPLRLHAGAAGQTFRIEVSAADDSGKKASWQVAGLLLSN